MSTTTLTAFTADQANNLRWWANKVRAYKGADQVAQRSYEDQGKRVTATLYKGKASDGYKSDYDRRPVFWVEVTISDGRSKYTQGRRFASEKKARAYFNN